MRSAMLLTLLVATVPAAAQEKHFVKAAWAWSSSDRMAARLDPALQKTRVEEHRRDLESRATALSGPQTFSNCVDEIDGDRHPELFFATELYDDLVTSAFVSLPAIYPLVVKRGAPDVFPSDADWQKFAAIAAPYASLLRRERELLNSATGAVELASIREQKPPTLIRTLRESRTAFGREPFDRMLYSVVAKGRSMCVPATMREQLASYVLTLKVREDRSQ